METISSALSGDALIAKMRKAGVGIQSQVDSMFGNKRKLILGKRQELEQEREVARRAAGDGDASENAPLQTAYENISRLNIELSAMEASMTAYESSRMQQVDETAQPGGVCSIGSIVCIEDVSVGTHPTWIIRLYPEGLGYARVGAIAVDTPLGAALLSHGKGETVQCAAPTGTIPYHIKEVI